MNKISKIAETRFVTNAIQYNPAAEATKKAYALVEAELQRAEGVEADYAEAEAAETIELDAAQAQSAALYAAEDEANAHEAERAGLDYDNQAEANAKARMIDQEQTQARFNAKVAEAKAAAHLKIYIAKAAAQAAVKTALGATIIRWGDGAYQGELCDGIPHGKGVWCTADEYKYEGEWSSGNWHGNGVLHYADGDVYEGEFHDCRLVDREPDPIKDTDHDNDIPFNLPF